MNMIIDAIVGLDVSSSKVGLAIIDLEGGLIEQQLIKFDSKKPLEERCMELEFKISSLGANYAIKDIFLEAPFIMFSGGKTTAATMSKLQRFNGMVSYMIRRSKGIIPTLIAANKARSLVGLKIKKGEDTKRKVIEWVSSKYPDQFIVEMTRHGNPKPGTDDMADATVVALAGLALKEKI